MKRGLGKKRIIRKSISMTNELEKKLERLSIATGLPAATIATNILEFVLNNPKFTPDFLTYFQNEYGKREQYKVVPIIQNGDVIF